LAPEIVQVLASTGFIRSIAVIRILSAVPLLLGFSHLTGVQLLIPLKNERIYFVFLLTAFIVNIIANLLLIPEFQEKGAALSNLITEGIIAVSTWLYLLKNSTLHLAFSSFLKYLLSSLILYPCVYLLRLLGFSPLSIISLALLAAGSIYLLLHIKVLHNPFVKKMFTLKVQE
jgi:O-antigen/teichoic acid export membrane protein